MSGIEFNELESYEVIRVIIQEYLLFEIKDKIQSLYKTQVKVGRSTLYRIENPCLYIEEDLSYKILFFNLERTKRKLLLEVKGYDDDTDFLRIEVWIMDKIIYPTVKDEFEKFGREHEKSISKINIIKDYV